MEDYLVFGGGQSEPYSCTCIPKKHTSTPSISSKAKSALVRYGKDSDISPESTNLKQKPEPVLCRRKAQGWQPLATTARAVSGLCCSSSWSCFLGKRAISDNELGFRKGHMLVTTSLCIKDVTLEALQRQEWGLSHSLGQEKNTNLDFIPGLTSTVLSELATTLTKTSPASG